MSILKKCLTINLLLVLCNPGFGKTLKTEKADPYKEMYLRYTSMREDIVNSKGNINTEAFFKKHKLELNDEDKRFIVNRALLTQFSKTQTTAYDAGVVTWKDGDYSASIDLKGLDQSILIVNGTRVQLDINFVTNKSFKSNYLKNQSLVKNALFKQTLSQMSWDQILVKVLILPFSVLTSCGENGGGTNEGILSSIAYAPVRAVEGAVGMGGYLAERVVDSCGYVGKRVCHEFQRHTGGDQRPYGESVGAGLKDVWIGK